MHEQPRSERKMQICVIDLFTNRNAELSVRAARRDRTRAVKKGMMQELLTDRTRLVKPQGACS